MLSFSSAIGNLFNRLGRFGKVVGQIRTYQTAQLTNLTDTGVGAVGQLEAESDIEAIIGDNYIGLLSGPNGAGGIMQQAAVAVANRMVFRDNPRLGQTLTSSNTPASLAEIIRQMKVAGATVLAQTITATPTLFSADVRNIGNGAVVASVRRPSDGVVLENAFAETLLFTCTDDSYDGNATAGQEPFIATGTGSQGDLFAFNWPLGSNARANVTVIDGTKNNSANNLLTNSGFDTFSGNVPSNWELTLGTAGTNVSQETGLVFGSGSALKLTGDGSGTLTTLRQKFNDSSVGTAGAFDALTQGGFNIWLRRDGVVAGAGQLTVELVDASGAVVKDAAGNNNAFTIDLTALTTQYAAYSGAFRTPLVMPSALYLNLRLSVALTNGRSVYLDRGGLGLMTQVGIGEPYVAVFGGSVPFAAGDYATAVITNSRGAAGSLSTFQTLWWQLFADARANELLLPSSATPSIPDTLITS